MRILIIDTDNLLRDGLCALLRLENDLDIIGTLDSVEALAHLALGTTPDVVILDSANPDCGGFDSIAKIRRHWSHVRVLVLTAQRDDRVLAEALRAGADAYGGRRLCDRQRLPRQPPMIPPRTRR